MNREMGMKPLGLIKMMEGNSAGKNQSDIHTVVMPKGCERGNVGLGAPHTVALFSSGMGGMSPT